MKKSRPCTPLASIRCASLSDRAPARSVQDNGSFQATNLRISTRTPGFQKLGVNLGSGLTNARRVNARNFPAYLFSANFIQPHQENNHFARQVLRNHKAAV
jgi:hypothetical protein